MSLIFSTIESPLPIREFNSSFKGASLASVITTLRSKSL